MITRLQSEALRGIAILSIILHNFSHWFPSVVQENEFAFVQRNVDSLLLEISHPDYLLPIHLLSFWGHYGVSIFIFLSGFGLARKYEIDRPLFLQDDNGLLFVWTHFKKLFGLLLLGYSLYWCHEIIHYQVYPVYIKSMILHLCMCINLIKNPAQNITPGPYWYFGLTMQLYLWYRFVFSPARFSLSSFFSQRFSTSVLFLFPILSILLQILFFSNNQFLIWLRYNSFGNIFVFCMGIFIARFMGNNSLSRIWSLIMFIVSALFVTLGSLNFYAWLFIPLFVCLFLVCTVWVVPNSILKCFVYLGNISSFMFILHPITRKIFLQVSIQYDVYFGLFVYLISTIFSAYAVMSLYNKICHSRGILKKMNNNQL